MPDRAERVAVLSDVHGNAVALEAVLAELQQEDADLVVFGGDLTWGPLPRETLALLDGLALPTFHVRGNAERALLEPADEPTERERWLAAAHSDEALAWLATFAASVSVDVSGLGPVRFCHGSPRSDEELVTPETPAERMRELSAGIEERTLVTAHTHLQFDRRSRGTCARSTPAASGCRTRSGGGVLGAPRPRRGAPAHRVPDRGGGGPLPGERRPDGRADGRDPGAAADARRGHHARREPALLGLSPLPRAHAVFRSAAAF